ncbi:unnamed protein product [Gongylonema pulchrum]|uniref:E3 SUMO-protein ligase NSE2 n=1 Tax=Gongylonema pulchrum TaxID=637853 RepID=A0A3P7R2K9_9BILA|nr:unnamed protein product [Gongylonema pulchrum]
MMCENPNQEGVATKKINALKKAIKTNRKADCEVELVYLSKKDPYTKRDIKDPVQNKHCKHVYDRSSVEVNIAFCSEQGKPCLCPISSCPNKVALEMADLIPYPEFFDLVKDKD